MTDKKTGRPQHRTGRPFNRRAWKDKAWHYTEGDDDSQSEALAMEGEPLYEGLLPVWDHQFEEMIDEADIYVDEALELVEACIANERAEDANDDAPGDAEGRHAGFAGRVHDPRARQPEVVEGRLRALLPLRAVAGGAAIDDSGVALLQARVVESEAGRDAMSVVLDEHVRFFGQRENDFEAFWSLQVDLAKGDGIDTNIKKKTFPQNIKTKKKYLISFV